MGRGHPRGPAPGSRLLRGWSVWLNDETRGLEASRGRNESTLAQIVDDGFGILFCGVLNRVEPDLGELGDLIGAIHAGEIPELAPPGFGIQPLGVATLAHLE